MSRNPYKTKAITRAITGAATMGEASEVSDISRTNAVVTAVFALGLGLGLLSVVGYAQASHDVAHDSRHAFSFPCH
ncbi:MAG: CbtB-domain containing protein [Rhodospirillaceae bacterium]|nr:CbtB-domain containing protein [Rhodospirillaceae bacterium]MCK5546465.1 CbtB-domain containing protein [Rhodospirillaceae bacterium]